MPHDEDVPAKPPTAPDPDPAREEAGREARANSPAQEPPEEEGPAPTPFDHPLFMPALLFAFSIWFGYDGWLNDDPKMVEHRTFNRVGFAVWFVLLLWTGVRGYRELRSGRHDSGSEGG